MRVCLSLCNATFLSSLLVFLYIYICLCLSWEHPLKPDGSIEPIVSEYKIKFNKKSIEKLMIKLGF